MVKWVALKYQGSKLEQDDLFQTGTIGLIKAIDMYDEEKGMFSTYATYWIRGTINRSIENYGKTIRIPSHLLSEANKLNQIKSELYKELGRAPTTKELSLKLNKSIVDIEELLEITQDPLSINSNYDAGEGSSTLENIIEDDKPRPDELIEEIMFLKEFEEAIRPKLTDIQYNSIIMSYGIGVKEYTLQEISKKYNKNIEYIRTERNDGLNIIRETKYCMDLQEGLDERTTYYKSIDYSIQGSSGKSNISPVERIAIEREYILKKLKSAHLENINSKLLGGKNDCKERV